MSKGCGPITECSAAFFLECGDASPLFSVRHVSRSQSAVVPAQSKISPGNFYAFLRIFADFCDEIFSSGTRPYPHSTRNNRTKKLSQIKVN